MSQLAIADNKSGHKIDFADCIGVYRIGGGDGEMEM
jgi:hypothetical protein